MVKNIAHNIKRGLLNTEQKIHAMIGKKRFCGQLRGLQKEIPYGDVHLHWENTESTVHSSTSEADFLEFAGRINKRLRLNTKDIVLDIGCGDGKIDSCLRDKCAALYGFDFAESKVEEATEKNPDCTYFTASFLDDYKKQCGYPFKSGSKRP